MSFHEELIARSGRWNIQSHPEEKEILSRFFKELKENKRIMGIRCPQCQRVIVTPRRFCEKCAVPNDEWVEVNDTGKVENFSIQRASIEDSPKTNYCLAFIVLDGADTAVMHHLGGMDLSDAEKARKRLKTGMRVRAKWKDKREGRMTDIEYFEPIEKE